MACKDALLLIFRNPARFAALGGLSGIFTVLGYLVITVGTAFLAYYDVTSLKMFTTDNISNYYIIVLVAGFIGYCISKLFMEVLGMALSTIMHCFILDEELAKSAGGNQASHTPGPLRDFLSKNSDYMNKKD